MMKKVSPAFQLILSELDSVIDPEVMAQRLKFCGANESLELIRMGYKMNDEKYWDKVRACSLAIRQADIHNLKNCATAEKRQALVSGWNESHLWSVSVEMDADNLAACTTTQEREALVSQWDVDYYEAVLVELADREAPAHPYFHE